MNDRGGLLDKLNRKIGRYAISNLMFYIVGGMAVVFVANLVLGAMQNVNLYQLLLFDKAAIFSGEVWRAVTFVLLPPDSGIIFIFFALYFYWLIGSALENHWGSFRFNAFYFCGVLCTIVSGLITGYATNAYVNLSLFFAFALLYPDFQIMLFFVLPVKIKYIAILDAVYFLIALIFNTWPGRIALLIALGNVALFFGGDFLATLRQWDRRRRFRRDAKR